MDYYPITLPALVNPQLSDQQYATLARELALGVATPYDSLKLLENELLSLGIKLNRYLSSMPMVPRLSSSFSSSFNVWSGINDSDKLEYAPLLRLQFPFFRYQSFLEFCRQKQYEDVFTWLVRIIFKRYLVVDDFDQPNCMMLRLFSLYMHPFERQRDYATHHHHERQRLYKVLNEDNAFCCYREERCKVHVAVPGVPGDGLAERLAAHFPYLTTQAYPLVARFNDAYYYHNGSYEFLGALRVKNSTYDDIGNQVLAITRQRKLRHLV